MENTAETSYIVLGKEGSGDAEKMQGIRHSQAEAESVVEELMSLGFAEVSLVRLEFTPIGTFTQEEE